MRAWLFLALAALLAASQPSSAVTPSQLLVLNGAGASPSLSLDFRSGILPASVTFSRAGSATYFDASGAMQTASANVARFDHNPVTHAALGLLLEQQATNILLNSATLSGQTVTTTATAYSLSFYGIGTITYSGTASGSLVGAGAFPARSCVSFTPSAGSLVLGVTGTVTDAQLEVGTSCTSYIATTSTAATRAVDAATIAIGSWFNSRAGTLVANLTIEAVVSAFGDPISLVGANGNTDFMRMYFTNWPTTRQFSLQIDAASVATGPAPTAPATLALNSPLTAGFTYGNPAVSVCSNTAISTLGTQGALPVITTLRLFIGSDFQTSPSGWLTWIKYWPSATNPCSPSG